MTITAPTGTTLACCVSSGLGTVRRRGRRGGSVGDHWGPGLAGMSVSYNAIMCIRGVKFPIDLAFSPAAKCAMTKGCQRRVYCTVKNLTASILLETLFTTRFGPCACSAAQDELRAKLKPYRCQTFENPFFEERHAPLAGFASRVVSRLQ